MTTKSYTDPELGTPGRVFGQQRCGRPCIDIEDFDAVRAAAHLMANGSDREVLGLSLVETRAMCAAAAVGLDAVWLASRLAALSDANADPAAIKEVLNSLIEFVRPTMGNAT